MLVCSYHDNTLVARNVTKRWSTKKIPDTQHKPLLIQKHTSLSLKDNNLNLSFTENSIAIEYFLFFSYSIFLSTRAQIDGYEISFLERRPFFKYMYVFNVPFRSQNVSVNFILSNAAIAKPTFRCFCPSTSNCKKGSTQIVVIGDFLFLKVLYYVTPYLNFYLPVNCQL